ncbi:MAG: hypothetical protein E3J54_00525, partial [Actinobacteria bacterium]
PVKPPVPMDAGNNPMGNAFGDIQPSASSKEAARAFLRYELDIPKDATVVKANLELTPNWTTANYNRALFYANIGLIDQDNVGSFVDSDNISNSTWLLPIAENKASWWIERWSGGIVHKSLDITDLVNSYISRNGYVSGSSYIGFRIDDGNAFTVACGGCTYTYPAGMALRPFINYENDPATSAKLRVVYTESKTRTAPIVADNGSYGSEDKEENLCFQCHGPNNDSDAPDIFSVFNKDFGHFKLFDNDKHKDTENSTDLDQANRHSECQDCHDPHKAEKENRQLGSNLAVGPIKGVRGVAIINGLPGTQPFYYFTNEIKFEYELCFKCHIDKAVEFNPNNKSSHPVVGLGKNLGIKDGAFKLGTPWNPTAGDDPDYGLTGNIGDPSSKKDPNYANGARVTCTDCHGNNSQGAKGPHGSSYSKILKKPVPELCLDCHNENTYMNGGENYSRLGTRGGHPAWTRGGHYLLGERMICTDCHGFHGSATDGYLGEGRDTIVFDKSDGKGKCSEHHWPDDAPHRMNYPHAYPHFVEQ